LSKFEKLSFAGVYGELKYHKDTSNIKSLVSMQDLKLMGLKSHDFRVLMQNLGILRKNVRHVITHLYIFLNAICKKMLLMLIAWMIMVHLIVHLVREIIICGHVFIRCMYLVDRCMKILKGYVKNLYCPKAFIVERCIVEEEIEFCTTYMSGVEAIGFQSQGMAQCVKVKAHEE